MGNDLKNLELYFDNYNLYNLIKKIDDGYKIYFDKKNKLFMIINSAKFNQICMKFNEISPEILKILQKTRIEHSREIFAEMDRKNAEIECQNQNICKQKLLDITDEFISFSKRANTISEESKNKIKEGRYA